MAFGDTPCKEMSSEYSQTKCFIKCIGKKIKRICGCVDFMFESRKQDDIMITRNKTDLIKLCQDLHN